MFAKNHNTLALISRLFLTHYDLAENFQKKFKLTKTEWELVGLSFVAKNRNEVASIRGVKPDTIEKQWKSIIAKLNVSKEYEAKQLVLGLGAVPKI